MKYLICITGIIVCMLIIGCRDKVESEENAIARAFRSDFRRNQEFMLHGGTNCALFAREIAKKLSSLSNEKIRFACINEWVEMLLELDLTHDSIIHQRGQMSTCWKIMEELFDKTLGHQMRTFEDRWNLQFRYLEWCRSQVVKMSMMLSYPTGVARKIDNYGRETWHLESSDQENITKYRSQLARYNFYASEYEEHLNTLETHFNSDCTNKGIDVKLRIIKRFENFLGRKIRTEAQCLEDYETKRCVEFPILIPTTNGLQKRWKPKAIGFYSY